MKLLFVLAKLGAAVNTLISVKKNALC